LSPSALTFERKKKHTLHPTIMRTLPPPLPAKGARACGRAHTGGGGDDGGEGGQRGEEVGGQGGGGGGRGRHGASWRKNPRRLTIDLNVFAGKPQIAGRGASPLRREQGDPREGWGRSTAPSSRECTLGNTRSQAKGNACDVLYPPPSLPCAGTPFVTCGGPQHPPGCLHKLEK